MCPRRSEAGLATRLRGYAAILRPVNASMMALAVLVGVVLASGCVLCLDPARLAAGMATGFLVLASAMVLNDYADAEVDRINAPERPIPSGLVTPRAALVYGAVLGAAGILLAAYTGPPTLVLALLAWLVSVAYDFWGKKTGLPGNFMVSFNVAMPIAYGAALASRFDPSIAVFWAMIFLSNTGREIIKGIADIPGDSARGIRTLAVARGPRAAAWAAALFIAAAVALSPLPYIRGEVSRLYLLVVMADIGFIRVATEVLRRPEPGVARRAKSNMLLYMLVGLIAFLLARLA